MKQKFSTWVLTGCLLISIVTVHADDNAIGSINTTNNTNAAATTDTISNHATNNEYTFSELTPDIYTKLDTNQQKSLADMWHLTVDDISRYLWLMRYTPNGYYYQDKHLDPSWILGFEAKNDEERWKYVLIALQNEKVRLNKELAFQQFFTRAQQQQYPNELPIRTTADAVNAALPKLNLSKK